jgi:hypothetical protein
LPARHGGAGTPFRLIRSLVKSEMTRGVRGTQGGGAPLTQGGGAPLTPHVYQPTGFKFYSGSYQDMLRTHAEILLKQTV